MARPDVPFPDRRCALVVAVAGAGAVLTACSSYGQVESAASSAASGVASAASGVASAASGVASAASGAASKAGSAASAVSSAGASVGSAARGAVAPAIASLSQVPVGGGIVLAKEKIVLTQPTAGTVKGFSAICTHQGCTVGEVSGGTINCPCHGSKFAIADGSVANGPAARPLPPIAVAVEGDRIVRA